MVSVLKMDVNLGRLPYFESAVSGPLREVAFHADRGGARFPRLRSLTRFHDVLEMNLFLEHRFNGLFMPPKPLRAQSRENRISLIAKHS